MRAVLGIDNIGYLAGLVGDYNNNGQIDVADMDVQADGIAANDLAFDLDADGDADVDDRFRWIHEIQSSWVGDSNFDGEFTSADFVKVFQGGKYETGEDAGWELGDWNGDKKFASSDFVFAFQDGGYENGPRPDAAVSAVPEPGSAVLALLGIGGLVGYIRRRTRFI